MDNAIAARSTHWIFGEAGSGLGGYALRFALALLCHERALDRLSEYIRRGHPEVITNWESGGRLVRIAADILAIEKKTAGLLGWLLKVGQR